MQDMRLFAGTQSQVKSNVEPELPLARLLHEAMFALPVSYKQKKKSQLAALATLQNNPELLFEKGYVKTPAGQLVYGSPYQVFLGAGDIWAINQIHEIILPLIKDGEEIAKQQYQEQFPRHQEDEHPLFDERNLEQIKQFKEALNRVIGSLSGNSYANRGIPNTKFRQAVIDLLEILAPKDGEVIKTGLHSPPEILRITHAEYDKQWNKWDPNELRTYSKLVIGGVVRYVSAVDAQHYKKGIFMFFNAKRKPDRTKSYINENGCISSKIGRETYIHVYYGDEQSVHAPGWEHTAKHLGILMSTKESELTKLNQLPEQANMQKPNM